MSTNMIEATPSARPAGIWARTFAVLYNPTLWVGERAGMRTRRSDLLAGARGRTLEIGSGTGLNLRHYPADLDELILAEPDPAMRSRLERRVARSKRDAMVISAPAEQLPFEDASIDTVVSTLVLCTVDDPELALREVVRVLRPEGQFLFIEHVRSDRPRLARRQDRFAAAWRGFARGCRCNRPTAELIVNSGLVADRIGTTSWRAMPSIVKPLITGRASLGADRP